eukprot:Awhi_evm1s9109
MKGKQCPAIPVGGLKTNQFLLSGLLADIYARPFHLESFALYCKKRHCTENLDFLLQLRELEKLENLSRKQEMIEKIYDNFIRLGSENEVNLTHLARQDVDDNYKNRTDETTIIKSATIKHQKSKDIVDDLPCDDNDAELINCDQHVFIFEKARAEIFRLVESDLFKPFIQETSAKQELFFAKTEALWFVKRKDRRLFYDGHIEENSKSQFHFRKFFSFPNVVVSVESQSNSLVSIILISFLLITDITLFFCTNSNPNVFKYFSLLYVPIVYGFLARFVCGPRLSPQSFFVLFYLAPTLLKKFEGIFKLDVVAGPPKRFAQLCGLFMTAFAFSLRIADYYAVSNSHRFQDHYLFIASICVWLVTKLVLLLNAVWNFFIASICVWLVTILVLLLNAVWNFCVGCFIYNGFFVRFGLVEPLCRPKSTFNHVVHKTKADLSSSNNFSLV